MEFDNEDVVDQLVKKQYHTIASKTVSWKSLYFFDFLHVFLAVLVDSSYFHIFRVIYVD